MAPHQQLSNPASDSNDEVISRIYLIRHGDRFDYANPSWIESAKANGALVTDPPLSALGHRQAKETADFLSKLTKNEHSNTLGNVDNNQNSHNVHKILVSPYLRVIQTACPTSDALNLPLSIEYGLSETHATPGNVLPTPKERFAYFPQVDPTYQTLHEVQPTPDHFCPRTGHPCEAFAGKYCLRMKHFATILEREFYGKNVVCYSHAASVALVAALLRCNMSDLKFAPCGIYELKRTGKSPWELVRNGGSNLEYVSENSPTTYPWGFKENHFVKREGGNSSGAEEGIGLDYFVQQSRM